jgi:hypothetical protein
LNIRTVSMSPFTPAWIEAQRRRWTRCNAHLWQNPTTWSRVLGPKTSSELALKPQQGGRIATKKMTELAGTRPEVRSFVQHREHFARKYSPDQPRVPAGNPDGGRWTTGDRSLALSNAVTALSGHPGLVLNDVNPDGIRVWAQYAEADQNKAQRDAAAVTRTTNVLGNTVAQVSSSVIRRPGSSPANYGTDVHTAFARTVRSMNLPGIGVEGVEQSFDSEGSARYGKDGSIRTDVVLRNEEGSIISVYDLKTGNAVISPPRAVQIRAFTGAGSDVPVIELHAIRGPAAR